MQLIFISIESIVPENITKDLKKALEITKDTIGRFVTERLFADANDSIFDLLNRRKCKFSPD